MAKPKTNTLQQRFGFLDDDLKTSKHDEIILWVDANIEDILKEIINYELIWKIDKELQAKIEAAPIIVSNTKSYYTNRISRSSQYSVEQDKKKYTQLSSWKGLGDMPPKPNLRVTKKRWEHPIVSKEYTIGFVDIYAVCEVPFLDISGLKYSLEGLDNDSKLPEWYIGLHQKEIAFEIKTSIPSLGELIRQIRMYQTYLPIPYIIVSPEDKFAKHINNQGINFYKYDPEKKVFQRNSLHTSSHQAQQTDLL